MMAKMGHKEHLGLGDGGGRRDGKPWGRTGRLGKGWGDLFPKEAYRRCAGAEQDCKERPSGFVERLQAPLHRCAKEWNGIGWRKDMECKERGFDDVPCVTEEGELVVVSLKGEKKNVEFVKEKEKAMKPRAERKKEIKNPGELLAEQFDKMKVTETKKDKKEQKSIKVKVYNEEKKVVYGERKPDMIKYNRATMVYSVDKKVLVCGTSLCSQALLKDVLKKETGLKVETVKLFTIEGDGKIKPELNVKEKLENVVTKTKPDILIVECGVNEVNNCELKNMKESEMKMENKAEKLAMIMEDISKNNSSLEIIILETLPRNDSMARKKLGATFNRRLKEVSKETKKVRVKKLDIDIKGKNQIDVFGDVGEARDNRPCDGYHLRGSKGKSIFTSKLILLVKSLGFAF